MTLKEIAAQLGVSASCISIVRKGKPGVSSATRRAVQLALEENGFSYEPFSAERDYTSPRHTQRDGHTICLLKHAHSALLTDNNEGFVAGLIDTISDAVSAAGYLLEVKAVRSPDYPAFIQAVGEDDYAGLLVIATEMTPEELLALDQVSIPTVVLDSDYPCIPHSSVSMNNRQLAWTAVSCLAQSGQVGYLRSNQPTGNFAARAVGYREAIAAFSLPEAAENVFSVTPSLAGAEADMNQWLAEGREVPPALFADNDVIAIGCMRALKRHGIRVPEDTQIIGVDDTLLSQVISPTLSSMQIPRSGMAAQAVRLLLEAIHAPAGFQMHIRLDARLIRRHSLKG